MEQELLNKARKKRRRAWGIIAVLAVFAALAAFGLLRQGGADPQGAGGGGDAALSADGSYVTMEVTCRDLSEHMDRLTDEGVREYIPEDGEILAPERVAFAEGETVYDVLYRTCREKKIHMESSEDPVYQSRYVEGIGHLYEKDAGKRSGWIYEVDGEQPNYGCSKYRLKKGQTVRWVYVTDYTEQTGAPDGGDAGDGGADSAGSAAESDGSADSAGKEAD